MEFTVEIPMREVKQAFEDEDIFEFFEPDTDDALSYVNNNMTTNDIMCSLPTDEILIYVNRELREEILQGIDPKVTLSWLIEDPNTGENWIREQLKLGQSYVPPLGDEGLSREMCKVIEGDPKKQAQILSQMLDMLKGVPA